MMSNVYYIDLENVQVKGLEGIGKIKNGDEVYIFYSDHAMPRIPFGIAQTMAVSKGKFVFKKVVELGKNALDKELISMVQKHMKRKKGYSYHIISRDKIYKKTFQEKAIYQESFREVLK